MPKPKPRAVATESTKYYTIYNPYPPHPNMELVGDQKQCAFWLAGIVGNPDLVISIYHKPRSPSAIIVGISDAFDDLRTLLGAHKWSDFLRTPGQDSGRVSKAYFCARTSHDEISKYGWKLNEVEDSWFAGKWRIDNKVIQYPYPAPSYCDIPKDAAAIIELGLALRHPVKIYPEGKKYLPPPDPVYVVGSQAYIAANAKRSVPGAAAPEPPKASKPRRRKKKAAEAEAGGPSPPTPPEVTTTTPTEPIDRPPSDDGLPPARAPDGDWFTAAAAAAGLDPHVDSVVGMTPVTNWAAEVDAAAHPRAYVAHMKSQVSPNPWGPKINTTINGSTKANAKATANTNGNTRTSRDLSAPSSSAPPGLPHPGLADAMANLEMDDDDEYSPDYGNYDDYGGDHGYDIYSDRASTLAPEDSASNIGRPAGPGPAAVDGTEGEGADDDWGGAPIFTYDTVKPVNAKRPGQPTDCPEHGLVCPRGICKFQAKKKAREEREKEAAEKKKAREAAIKKANERKFGPKGNEREPPPHWHTAKSTDSSSIAPGDSVSMQGSRPGSPSDFNDEEYGGGDNNNDDDEARTEMNATAPQSAAGWTDASRGFNKTNGLAGPSVASSNGPSVRSHNGQATPSASGWTDASYGAGAAWKGQQAASTYGTQASNNAPSVAARSAWGNGASQASSNGGAWRKQGNASAVNGAPSKAPSAVSRSGWTDASAIPNLSNGDAGSAWGPPAKATQKPPPSNGGWDDDARSNITVSHSKAGGNKGTASALGLPIVEKDPWDDTLSEHTVSETNGWGAVPVRGKGRGGAGGGPPPSQRARGGAGGGRARGRGRGWNTAHG